MKVHLLLIGREYESVSKKIFGEMESGLEIELPVRKAMDRLAFILTHSQFEQPKWFYDRVREIHEELKTACQSNPTPGYCLVNGLFEWINERSHYIVSDATPDTQCAYHACIAYMNQWGYLYNTENPQPNKQELHRLLCKLNP